jgi:hypothetical protein
VSPFKYNGPNADLRPPAGCSSLHIVLAPHGPQILATMAHMLRGKQAGVQKDLSSGITPEFFGLDDVGSTIPCPLRRLTT